MIPQRNISILSTKLSIPEKTIEKDYVISWILIGIAQSALKDILLFKGGTALKKFYIQGYRFSEDLDFTLTNFIKPDNLKEDFIKVFEIIKQLSNITLRFDASKDSLRPNTYTFYINYSGPLGADITRGEIKTDITLKETIIYVPIQRGLLNEYNEYSDLTYENKLFIYDIREVFIEKLCCVLAPSRNEPRDIYDLWYLIVNELVPDPNLLTQEFTKKAQSKLLSGGALKASLDKKEDTYAKLWASRLKHQINLLPDFNRVYRELKRELKKYEYVS